MAKRITNIEDLASIAGNELAKSTGKTTPSPLKSTSSVTSTKIKDTNITPIKTENSTKTISIIDDNYKSNYDSLGHIDFEVIRNMYNPIDGYTKAMTKEQLLKSIEDEKPRIEIFEKIYQENLDAGHNVVGYKLAAISVQRAIERMEKMLLQLEKELDDSV